MGSRLRLVVACSALASLLLAKPAFAETLTSSQSAAIAAIATRELSLFHMPGLSIAIERDGRLLYAKGFGYRDVATKTPVDPATYFEIGSVTKQFTAAAIALLAADGKLHFDDTVATYLPDAPHATEITIRELLNHTSGLPDYLGVQASVTPLLFSTTATPADLYRIVAKLPLNFVPGTQFAYSNTNYVLLGAIIERITGTSYAAFLRERLLRNSTFSGVSYGVPPGKPVADGYDRADPVKPLTIWSSNVSYAAGGLYATPSDLARWDDAFFNGRVVPPPMVAALTTAPTLSYGKKTDYAAGWIDSRVDGHPEIWHNGGLPGFSARNAYFPEQHLAIVVLCNTMGFDAATMTREMFRVFIPQTPAQVAAEMRPASGEDPTVTARVREQWSEFVSGHVDRSLYDANLSAKLPDALVAQVAAQLASLGQPTAFVFVGSLPRTTPGTAYQYRVIAPGGTTLMTIAFSGADKIDGIFFKPDDGP